MDTLSIMIRTIEIMSSMKLPIVFKGALVLNDLLRENNIDGMRLTKDIDGDYIDTTVTMNRLEELMQVTINSLGVGGLTVQRTRDFGVGRSAGFDILKDGEKLFSIDMSVKNNRSKRIYSTYTNIKYYGASKEKIYVDKMVSISDKTVYRRIKDMYDLYLMSSINGFSTQDINNTIKESNKNVGDFKEFLNNIQDLEHAYSKFRGIIYKTPFVVVYGRVRDFCMPYIVKCNGRNAAWSPQQSVWY